MGEEVEINEAQHHPTHEQIHRGYINSPEYDNLKMEHPDRAEKIMKHWSLTRERTEFDRQEAMKEQAAMAQAGVQARQGQSPGAQAPPAEVAA